METDPELAARIRHALKVSDTDIDDLVNETDPVNENLGENVHIPKAPHLPTDTQISPSLIPTSIEDLKWKPELKDLPKKERYIAPADYLERNIPTIPVGKKNTNDLLDLILDEEELG